MLKCPANFLRYLACYFGSESLSSESKMDLGGARDVPEISLLHLHPLIAYNLEILVNLETGYDLSLVSFASIYLCQTDLTIFLMFKHYLNRSQNFPVTILSHAIYKYSNGC